VNLGPLTRQPRGFRLGVGEDQQVGEHTAVHRTRRIPMSQQTADADPVVEPEGDPVPAVGPICSGTANNARTPSSSATECTGRHGIGTPGLGLQDNPDLRDSLRRRPYAAARGSALIGHDQFDDLGPCLPYPCERDWLAPAGIQSPV
jgi:hypothetical protein